MTKILVAVGYNKKILSLLRVLVLGTLVSLWLSGCAGGDEDDGQIGTGKTTGVIGTAAEGDAIANAAVTVIAEDGQLQTSTSSAQGEYEFTFNNNTGPFLAKVQKTDGTSLIGVAYRQTTTGDETIVLNLHPYTDLIVRNWFASQNISSDTFDAFFIDGATVSVPDEPTITAIKTEIEDTVALALEANGVPSTFDILTSAFTVNHQAFDLFLDNSSVDIVSDTVSITVRDEQTDIQTQVVSGLALDTNIIADTNTPPTAVSALRAGVTVDQEVVLAWSAATDDIGVAGYNVYQNQSLVGTTIFPVFVATGLSGGESYSFSVEAFDNDGLVSASVALAEPINIDEVDTTPPNTPTNLVAVEVDGVVELNWTQSGIGDVQAFRVIRNSNLEYSNITATEFTDFDVEPGNQYCYRVESFDAANNVSVTPSEEACVVLSGGAGGGSTSRLSFSSASYSTTESSAMLRITVERSGDLSEAVSVQYQVTGQTASAGQDYFAQDAVLNWEAGDGEAQNFTIQIYADDLVEEDETLLLSLVDPMGSMLGTFDTAEVTISEAVSLEGCIDFPLTSIITDIILDQPCYRINSDIEVDNATLTITEGVTLEFADDVALTVQEQGRLIAEGTLQNPILFTGATKSPGAWVGIFVNSLEESRFNYSVIEYAGRAGVEPRWGNILVEGGATVGIENSVIRYSSASGLYANRASIISSFSRNIITLNVDHPVTVDVNSAGMLDKESFYENNGTGAITISVDAIRVHSATTLIDDQTWQNLSVPYDIFGRATVAAVLTLEPGTVIASHSLTTITVNETGRLVAVGTELQPITFTADFNGSSETTGRWGAIEFVDSANNSIFDYAIIEMGGNGNFGITQSLIGFTGASTGTVSNSNIRNSSSNGIWIDQTSTVDTSTGNVFENIVGEDIFSN